MRSYSCAEFAHVLRQRAKAMQKKTHAEISKIWRACAAQFVDAVAARVHVDTGMSLAALLSLRTAINSRTTPLSSTYARLATPLHRRRAGHKELTGRFFSNNGRWKTAQFGRVIGRDAVLSQAWGISFGSQTDPLYKFRFQIQVYQHWLHEDDWASTPAGRDAFRKLWRQMLKESKLAEKIRATLIGD